MPPRPKPGSRISLALVLAGAGAVAAGAWWWMSGSRPAITPPAPDRPALTTATATTAEVPAPPLPPAPDAGAPRGGYVGRARCAECHAKQHDGWARDWHARALSTPAAETVVGRYDGVHYKGTSSEAWMQRDKGAYKVRTTGPDGVLASYSVDWVIGGKRMQDPMTVFPDGRWQILPVYFHVTGKGEWVDYTESKQGALGPDHPFYWTNFRRTANRECLDCHVTGLEVRYDRSQRAWSTSMVDAGVACESCHGPGERHAETQAPEDIVQPGKAPPEIGLALCAQCHGPRSPLFPMLDASHRFAAGERYEDRYQPHGLVNGKERSGDFFADGRPKVSSFEYQALVQSRCHLKGKATCLSCHTAPHEPHDAAEMKPPAAAEPRPAPKDARARADASACKGCHERVFADAPAHAHHRAKEAQSCIACHMPPVVTGVLDVFADHAIDIPVPENTTRHHIPNACNVCHDKETPEEMARVIAERWPGAARRAERRRRLADAFDEDTKEQSLAPLEAVIADAEEAPLLRANAAQLLAARFPGRAREVITPLLASPDPLVRTKAVDALGLAGAKDAAIDLARLGSDPSAFVREAAALVLAQLGDPRAEGALRSLTVEARTEGLPRPHALLALTLMRRGKIDEAAVHLERALTLMPYYIDALLMLADIQARKERFDLTAALIEEALRFDPQHEGARKRRRLLTEGR